MKAVLIAGGLAMLIALLGTPLFIRFLVARQYGQFIRQDGPTAHFTKRGTPTMGGVVIIGATLLGWVGALVATGTMPSASAVLVLFLMTGLGVVGFLDDYIKISRQRSLGLKARWKIVGQGLVGGGPGPSVAVERRPAPDGAVGIWLARSRGRTRIPLPLVGRG